MANHFGLFRNLSYREEEGRSAVVCWELFSRTFYQVFSASSLPEILAQYVLVETLSAYRHFGLCLFSEVGCHFMARELLNKTLLPQNKILLWLRALQMELLSDENAERDDALNFVISFARRVLSLQDQEWEFSGLSLFRKSWVEVVHHLQNVALENKKSAFDPTKWQELVEKIFSEFQFSKPESFASLAQGFSQVFFHLQEDPFLVFLWRVEAITPFPKTENVSAFYLCNHDSDQELRQKKMNLFCLSALYPKLNRNEEHTSTSLEKFIQKKLTHKNQNGLKEKIAEAVKFGFENGFLFKTPFRNQDSYHLNEKGLQIFRPFEDVLLSDHWRKVFLDERKP